MRPVRGSTANCTFAPPVSTPMACMHVMAALRMAWYSLSVSVWIGATVMLSPVWTPMGSRFSMEQTMTTLPALSRMSSSSYSFQPKADSSTSTVWTGLSARPRRAMRTSASRLWAMPPPVPPSVNDGLMMTGYPTASAKASASSTVDTSAERSTSSPAARIVSRKSSLSSARSITSADAPMSSTPNRSRIPALARANARFKPVWPPMVGRSASGRSLAMTAVRASTVRGSI